MFLHNANYTTEVDQFDGITKDRMWGNQLACGPTDLLGQETVGGIYLQAQRTTFKDGRVTFNFIVQYTGSGWLFIESGESLVMLVDGQRIGFKGDGSIGHREVIYGGNITEVAWYSVTTDDLARIANAKEVKVKLSGSKYYTEGCFNEQNFINLREFISRYPAIGISK